MANNLSHLITIGAEEVAIHSHPGDWMLHPSTNICLAFLDVRFLQQQQFTEIRIFQLSKVLTITNVCQRQIV